MYLSNSSLRLRPWSSSHSAATFKMRLIPPRLSIERCDGEVGSWPKYKNDGMIVERMKEGEAPLLLPFAGRRAVGGREVGEPARGVLGAEIVILFGLLARRVDNESFCGRGSWSRPVSFDSPDAGVGWVVMCKVCLGRVICADEVSILRRFGTDRFLEEDGVF